MNFKKAEIMFNSLADCGEDILIEGVPLEKVDSKIYLDELTTMNSNKETEIK